MDPTLYRASKGGNVDHIFYEKKEEILQQFTPNKDTVLHVAAKFGNITTVQKILELSPSLLNHVNNKQETPLHIAAKQGHANIVLALIESAKKSENSCEVEHGGVGSSMAKKLLRMIDENEDTALHQAARNRSLEVVKLLIQEDPEFEFQANKAGETPLYLAAEGGFDEGVVEILRRCNNPSYEGPLGRTALHAAVISPRSRILKRITTESSASARCVRLLVEWKPSLCQELDDQGCTPLHYAAWLGKAYAVRKILNINTSVAYKPTGGGRGADGDRDWTTAIHIATNAKNINIMRILSEYCPDCLEMVNSKSQNILHVAALISNAERREVVIKYILEDLNLGAQLFNEKDNEGNTALHLLAASSRYVEKMVKFGSSDSLAFNNQNMTPRDVLETRYYMGNCGFVFHEDEAIRWFNYCPNGCRKLSVTDQNATQFRDGNFSVDEKAAEEDPQQEKDAKRLTKSVQEIKEAANTHLVVATLIATVTFAAGFTMPGGVDSNNGEKQGMAVLAKRAAFRAFAVSDTIGFVCSLTAVYCFLLTANIRDKIKLISTVARNYQIASMLLEFAILSLVVAFVTGAFAVLQYTSLRLAITICTLGLTATLLPVAFVSGTRS